MGSSADGEVFFGYDLGELDDMRDDEGEWTGPAWLDPDEGDGDEWEEMLAAHAGVVEVPFPDHVWHEVPSRYGRGITNREPDREHPDYVAWSNYRDAVRDVVNSYNVEMFMYGHMVDGVTYRAVRIKDRHARATYECVPLDDLVLIDDQYMNEWRQELDTFMETLGIPIPKSGAHWYLTSTYG